MTDQPLLGSSWRTDLFSIPEYLDAIGLPHRQPSAGRGGASSSDLLEELHGAHVRTLPFANVDVLLGRHPGVSPDEVQRQLIERNRGGYCFEHAQIFAAALDYFGFTFRRALGRVGTLANTRTHTSLIVTLDGEQWLCDPGFGFSVTGPIRLRDGATRTEGDRTFSIRMMDDDGTRVWALVRDGEVQHFVDELPAKPVDVRTGHLITSTAEHSIFTRGLIAMRHTQQGHVTITEGTRTVRAEGQPTLREEITIGEAVEAVRNLGVEISDDEAHRLMARLRDLHPELA